MSCMQDIFARAHINARSAYAADKSSARATIEYLVYNYVSCSIETSRNGCIFETLM